LQTFWINHTHPLMRWSLALIWHL